MKRRSLLALPPLLLITTRAAGATGSTPSQTPGPFYPQQRPLDDDGDLVQVAGRPQPAHGTVLHLTGRVMDLNGMPMADSLVEIWQCDARGRYHHPEDRRGGAADPSFQGFGHVQTGKDGTYRFRTIRPVPYPGRTPHIHFAVEAPGKPRLVTQMYVDGETGNERDYLYNQIPAPLRKRVTVPLFPAADPSEGCQDGSTSCSRPDDAVKAPRMNVEGDRMMSGTTPQVLLFDVFGTVVDWRGSVIEELESFAATQRLDADWATFTDEWRAGFRELQASIARGDTPWLTMDQIHRKVLDRLLAARAMNEVADAALEDLNRAWHRLKPWPDTVEGLTRLKRRFIISPLSNGNLSMLVRLAKNAGLPWDCVLSTAMFSSYKPNPDVYQGAARMLDVDPQEVMMVAAHAYDVDGAKAAGFRTAYVFRPEEFGPGRGEDPGDVSRFDVVAASFVELARALGC